MKMFWRSLTGFTLALTISSSADQTPPALVLAVNPVIVRQGQALAFDLINRSEQPVKAWHVGLTIVYADGRKERKSVFRDGYAEESVAGPGGPRRVATIRPGGALRVETLLDPTMSDTPVVTVDLRVRSAILADGSSVGDPDDVNLLMERRSSEHRAWVGVLSALEQSQATLSGRAAIQAALQALNEPAESGDLDHPVKQIMRRNLRRVLEDASGTGPDPDEFMHVWVKRVRHRVQISEASLRAVDKKR